MDVSAPLSRVPSGTYRLVPAGAETFAKMDAWDGRVDRGNDFDIKAIRRDGRRFAKDDVIGAAAPTC